MLVTRPYGTTYQLPKIRPVANCGFRSKSPRILPRLGDAGHRREEDNLALAAPDEDLGRYVPSHISVTRSLKTCIFACLPFRFF